MVVLEFHHANIPVGAEGLAIGCGSSSPEESNSSSDDSDSESESPAARKNRDIGADGLEKR